jgi:methylated-DNA-[protein]-cysteine S-methyltransferase
MKQALKYTVFAMPLGWIACLGSNKGLRTLTLPQPSPQQALDMLGEEIDEATHDPDFFADTVAQVTDYFNLTLTNFSLNLDYGDATPFQKAVWEATRTIPHGKTQSYGWIAGKIKSPKAARSVGTALGKNPLPLIVPCHRVLGSDGGLCGFGGGLQMKAVLLELEQG